MRQVKTIQRPRDVMIKILRLFASGLCGLLLVSGCAAVGEWRTPAPIAAPSPTQTRAPEGPVLRGEAITWRNLQGTVDQVELTDSFMTDFGIKREPGANLQFAWVHIQLKNVGSAEIGLPVSEHFSVLYAESEFKPTYGHRLEYADYANLAKVIFPGQTVDGWLRFDLPATAQLNDLRVVFLPESSQVGVSPNSKDYPWGSEHPTFVWIVGK